jgi:hypothetical protein
MLRVENPKTAFTKEVAGAATLAALDIADTLLIRTDFMTN